MSVDSFSKGIVEIISSSRDAERVENEILQVFNALSKSTDRWFVVGGSVWRHWRLYRAAPNGILGRCLVPRHAGRCHGRLFVHAGFIWRRSSHVGYDRGSSVGRICHGHGHQLRRSNVANQRRYCHWHHVHGNVCFGRHFGVRV